MNANPATLCRRCHQHPADDNGLCRFCDAFLSDLAAEARDDQILEDAESERLEPSWFL